MSLKAVSTYCLNIGIAADQLANTIIGGHPDETLSSRCYRNSAKYWYAKAARIVLDVLFRPWGAEHCRHAYESELNRSHNFEINQGSANSSNGGSN